MQQQISILKGIKYSRWLDQTEQKVNKIITHAFFFCQFWPDDEVNIFFPNVGTNLTGYVMSQPKKT